MRKSKYEMMIGSVVLMSFADVTVSDYRSQKPDGKKYYKREIEIDNLLWVSVQSFEKQSFSKRYFKAIEESKKVVKEEEPVKYEIRAMSDIYCWRGDRSTEVARAIDDMANIDSIPELKKYFNTECKKFHPDHGGNAEDFAEVRFWYEEELRNIESIQAALDEILNESVVKEEEPTKFELVVSEFQKDSNTFSDLRESDDLDAFMGCETEEEVKETYKRLAKIYHPDCGGSQIQFEVLKDRYEFSLRRVRRFAEVVGEIKEMQDLRTTYNLKDLKSAYKKLARKHHPDHGGDVEQFKLVKTIYDVRKLCIEENAEVFGYDDPNFAFLVDLDEDLYKKMNKIVY